MDMHNILSTFDVTKVCVKSQHAICNASITKGFKNMPYLEGGKLLIKLIIISPKGANELKQAKIDVKTSTFLQFLLHLPMWCHFNGM